MLGPESVRVRKEAFHIIKVWGKFQLEVERKNILKEITISTRMETGSGQVVKDIGKTRARKELMEI